MCYYDVVAFFCGCRRWGDLRKECDKATSQSPGDPPCQLQRVRKHVYDRRGQKCENCGGPNWVDDETYERSRVQSRRYEPVAVDETPCPFSGCFLLQGHPPPHAIWTPCDTTGCILQSGHYELLGVGCHGGLSRALAGQLSPVTREALDRMRMLNLLVLAAMGIANDTTRVEIRKLPAPPTQIVSALSTPSTAAECALDTNEASIQPGSPYMKLDFSSRQIRLFELYPAGEASDIEGSFHCIELSDCPNYTALSYTWGDQMDTREIKVVGGETMSIRENLWWYFRQQSLSISRRKFFWVDAICINQSNVHERNHQVGLMKQIYVNATEVNVWLGREAENSDLAMDYITKKAAKKLLPRGPGFYSVWTREEGLALCELFERPYWRRMWIIQEIIHAEKITVWCGTKSFEWSLLESLYLKLKTLENTSWFSHHEFVMRVLQSSAGVMVWQRAHWRHPETPTPRLQTLIEVFHQWQCSDVRDKVYALVGMSSSETAIVPDYSLSAREVYFAIQEKDDDDKAPFYSLLSQALGLPERDVMLPGRDLIEYKCHPPEQLILRKRVYDE